MAGIQAWGAAISSAYEFCGAGGCGERDARDGRLAVATGITALHAAVQKEGHLDVVVALLEHGADVDCTTAKGNTALM